MSAKFLSLLAVSFFATANAAQIDVEDWVVPFDGPKEWQASVGDTMSFFWPEFHDVWIHPTGNCTLADRVEIGKQSGASYTFADTDGSAEGTRHFFACDVGDGAHCRFGEYHTIRQYICFDVGGVQYEVTQKRKQIGLKTNVKTTHADSDLILSFSISRGQFLLPCVYVLLHIDFVHRSIPHRHRLFGRCSRRIWRCSRNCSNPC